MISPKQTRTLLRAAHNQSSDQRSSLITTIYGLVLITAMCAAVFLNGVHVAMRPGLRSPALACGLALIAASGVWAVLRWLGPASASSSVGRWLAWSEVDRPTLFGGTVVGAAAVGGFLGGLGGLVAAMGASARGDVWLLGAATGCFLGAGMVGPTLVVQVSRRARLGRWVTWMFFAAGALMTVLALSSAELGVSIPALPLTDALTAAGIGSLGATFVARRWLLTSLRLTDALAPGEAISALVSSSAGLDTAALSLRAERSRLARRNQFRSKAPRGGLGQDLIRRESARLVRAWDAWLPRCAWFGVAWLVSELFGPPAAAVTVMIGCLSVAFPLTESARTWLGSTALWRMLPQNPSRVALWLLAVPSLVLALAGTVTGWIVGIGPGGFALMLATMYAMVRRHRAPDMQLGAMIDTPFGGFPLGLTVSLLYGFELVVMVLLLGLTGHWWVAVGVGLTGCVMAVADTQPLGAESKRS